MKTKNLLKLRVIVMLLLVCFMLLGATMNANAEKYEVTSSKSAVTQATEITLSGSTVNKFYYLFRVDENGDYQFVTYMVGQSYELNYAPQKAAGKYVVYEFNEFKGMPFNAELYNPKDGILQTGEITISSNQN